MLPVKKGIDKNLKHKKRNNMKKIEKVNIEDLVYDSCHSLILSNTPQTDKIDFNDLANKVLHKNINITENGLFDTVAPNFNNYYPEVSEEDLKMEDKDFIFPVYRGLSETIVNGNFTDFSMNSVLKQSMSKLKGQTVYVNHDMIVGAHIGVVMDTKWSESYKSGALIVPAGINTKLKIDIKSNPNIARGIMMDPPAIHSVSATLQFAWEKSHSKMEDNEFWTKLGTPGPDKQMVRKVAIDIVRYYELSMVSHGADPYAKRVGEDGKLIPENLARQFSQNSLGIKPTSYHYFSFRELGVEKNNLTIPNPINDNENDKNDMKEFLEKLALNLKLTGDQTEDTIITALSDIITKSDSVATLQTSVDTLTGEKNDLTTKVTDLTTKVNDATVLAEANKLAADSYNTLLVKLRANVLANYVKLKGETKDEAIVNLIGTANYDTLQSLDKDYTTQLEDKFPMTCKDCNGHNINRATAKHDDKKDGGNKKKSQTDLYAEANKISIHS